MSVLHDVLVLSAFLQGKIIIKTIRCLVFSEAGKIFAVHSKEGQLYSGGISVQILCHTSLPGYKRSPGVDP